MTYDPEKHHRRTIRLPEYDYRQSGAYFITICTQNKKKLFGEITDDAMDLNNTGGIVQEIWDLIPNRFPHVLLDAFVIMPNHIHGILIVGAGSSRPLHIHSIPPFSLHPAPELFCQAGSVYPEIPKRV